MFEFLEVNLIITVLIKLFNKLFNLILTHILDSQISQSLLYLSHIKFSTVVRIYLFEDFGDAGVWGIKFVRSL